MFKKILIIILLVSSYSLSRMKLLLKRRIGIPKRLFVAILLLGLVTKCNAEEQITITTYYPSPYGSYNQLQTYSLGVGDNDNDGELDSGDVPTTQGDVWIKGNVGIGTTSPTHKIHLVGGAYCDGTGDWIAGSDRAYKKDINYDFKYGLKEVEQLKPVYYVHREDKNNKKQIGFIAQDVLKVIPELVSGDEGALGLSYGQLTAVLVNAVKEQQKEIEELKSHVMALKGAKKD